MSIQQLMLGVGAKKKTYLDDVFSTYVYTGTGSSRSINTGVNMSEGGLVWIKDRDASVDHNLYDTVRGVGKYLVSNSNAAEGTSSPRLNAFNNNGFGLGGNSAVNGSGTDFSSWTFRKAPGFFDIVTWTGNGSNRTIAHSLGSVPGIIMVKCTSIQAYWWVYNRGIGATKVLYLNDTSAAATNSAIWNDTEPTSTNFSLGTGEGVNKNGETYVAYVFAGGESTAATANSCAFSSSHLSIPDHVYSGDPDNNGNWTFWSNPFTIEMWIKSSQNVTSGNVALVGQWFNNNKSWEVSFSGANNSIDKWCFKYATDGAGSNTYRVEGARLDDDQWHHIAVVRDNSTIKTYTDGVLNSSHTHSNRSFHNSAGELRIGSNGFSHNYTGKISNLRIIRHVSQYTSPFKAPTAPLTDTGQSGSNVTGTVLLCCNSSTNTGSTFTSGTITANGTVTASSDSPFDDPAGFVFGESGSENVIKCGSYVGNGSSTGPEIFLGWEPSFVLTKNADISDEWYIFDNMRGIVSGGYDPRLRPNSVGSEASGDDRIDVTPTGFKIKNDNGDMNGNGNTIIYIAIRRSDGYVGKPPELGTDVFTMDTGSGSSSIPTYDSGFPVDFAVARTYASANNWNAVTRLRPKYFLRLNTTDAGPLDHSDYRMDSNVGWARSDNSTFQSWMWKRHAGFDLVAYDGNGIAGRGVPHSLSKTPEMLWVKKRSSSSDGNWSVYHKGLNGGVDPEDYYINLNDSAGEINNSYRWNDTPHSSTHFTLGTSGSVNDSGQTYICMLFASVDSISKCGFYTGSSSAQTITLGFQPRFIIIKRVDGVRSWNVFDTLRGIGTGGSDDKQLVLDGTAAQSSGSYLNLTSTGMTLDGANIDVNNDGYKYIYYAHA